MKKLLFALAFVICLPLVGLILAGLSASVSTAIPDGARGQYYRIDDLNIRVWQQGQGPDLLLIHGLPGSIEDWDPVMDELAKHFRVTAFDRPGHGYSEFRKESSNLPGNVDIALGVIDALQLQDVMVVGHSYGGAMTVEMASRNPEQVSGYVSVAGLFKRHRPVSPIYQIVATPLTGPGFVATGNDLIGEKMMREGLERAFSPTPVPNGLAKDRAPMWLTVKNGLATGFEQVSMIRDLGNLDFKKIKSPFVIVHGDSDASVDPANLEIGGSLIEGSHTILLEDTGHMVQFSHPQAVINAVKDLATKLAASKP